MSSDQTWRERAIEARRESDDALIAYRAEHDRLTVERDDALATIERLDEDVAKWISQAVDAEATIERVKALITGWQGGTGHADGNKFVSIADLRAALGPSS